MCTKNELEIILQKMANAYKTVYGKDMVRLMLYGSYAKGTQQRDSDIDIVAIVNGDRHELQERLKKIWDVSSELELEYETIVSPTVIPYEEFEQYKDDLPYYRNIQNEGVDIVA